MKNSPGPRGSETNGFIHNNTFSLKRKSTNKESEELSFSQKRSINRENKGLGDEKPESRLSSSTLICNKKQRRIDNIVVILDGGEDKIRRWDEMHGPLLVKIFQGVPIWNLMFWVCTVCRSWLSSVLDTLFTSSTVLDLRILDTLKHRLERSRGLNLLRLLLETRPQTQWTTFYNAVNIWLRTEAVLYIAQRTPCLQYLVIHSAGVITIPDYWEALRYWKDLRGVNLSFYHCDDFITRAYELGSCCKKICSLTLRGRFGSEDAAAIVRNFPKLERLDLQHCILSREALVIILDGCKGLTRLDLRHTRCVEKENFPEILREGTMLVAKELGAEIHEKAVGIKEFLCCERKLCTLCGHYYTKAWHIFDYIGL